MGKATGTRVRCGKSPSLASDRLRVCRSTQCHGSLTAEQEESERLLQVQADGGFGVAEIPDGDILANVQLEIAATCGEHESAGDGGRPDDLIFHQPFDMLQDRVSMIASLSKCGIGVSSEQYSVTGR